MIVRARPGGAVVQEVQERENRNAPRLLVVAFSLAFWSSASIFLAMWSSCLSSVSSCSRRSMMAVRALVAEDEEPDEPPPEPVKYESQDDMAGG